MTSLSLLLLIPIVLIQGLFAGSEIALISADRLKLRSLAKSGSAGARVALKLVDAPERIFAVTLLVTTLCVISISTLLTIYFNSRNYMHAELIATGSASILIVVFGELIPKSIYRSNSLWAAQWCGYPLLFASWLFYPITGLFRIYTAVLSRVLTPLESLLSGHRTSPRDDLRYLLSYSRRESESRAAERTMVRRIIEFKDMDAKHALLPLVRVDAIQDDVTVDEALNEFKKHRHSRMPVYQDRVDNITGVVNVASLLNSTLPSDSIKKHVQKVRYVAASQRLPAVLEDLQASHTEMVVVVDEYGGAIGILTLEDILEEIVGEIQDEYDLERQPVKPLTEDQWVVEARVEVQRLNETIRIDIPQGEYETLSGFLLQQFGRIPDVGDELYFDTQAGSFRFQIRASDERRINTVLIELLKPSDSH